MRMTLRFIDFIDRTNHSLQGTLLAVLGPGLIEWWSKRIHKSIIGLIFDLIEYRIRSWTLGVRCWTFVSFFFALTGRSFGRRLG